eukprot:6206068-Pleurochrysis_carterae.AAC.1
MRTASTLQSRIIATRSAQISAERPQSASGESIPTTAACSRRPTRPAPPCRFDSRASALMIICSSSR